MYKNQKISVVVPAFNEEKLIKDTLDNIPIFVDSIIVIDDYSDDSTYSRLEEFQRNSEKNISIFKNVKNQGVGFSIKRGYQISINEDIDIAVVMAGDNQMDPKYLPDLLDNLIDNNADYCKGNRLHHQDKNKMPLFRRFGNNLLTLLNKISTGYWEISDPQNGYTAITSKAIKLLDFDKIYDGYGYCNDILANANIHNFKVIDVDMPPRYGSETSSIRIISYSIKMSFLLLKSFFKRINNKYGGNNFHPIMLFYYISFLSLITFGILSIRMFWVWYDKGFIPQINAMAVGISLILGFQLLGFSLWLDSRSSKI